MLLFTDVITNDELCSDAYDPKEVDGVVYEVDCAMITIKDGDVDIGEWSPLQPTALRPPARSWSEISSRNGSSA